MLTSGAWFDIENNSFDFLVLIIGGLFFVFFVEEWYLRRSEKRKRLMKMLEPHSDTKNQKCLKCRYAIRLLKTTNCNRYANQKRPGN